MIETSALSAVKVASDHVLHFYFTLPLPEDPETCVQSFRSQLGHSESLWSRLTPKYIETYPIEERFWEESLGRLLPKAQMYLYRFFGEKDDLQSVFTPAVDVYELRRSPRTHERAQPGAVSVTAALNHFFKDCVYRLVPNKPTAAEPFIDLSFKLANAWLYLFELGQLTLRLDVKLNSADGISIGSVLRFLDTFSCLDPAAPAYQNGGFLHEPHASGDFEDPKWSFNTYALINWLLLDLDRRSVDEQRADWSERVVSNSASSKTKMGLARWRLKPARLLAELETCESTIRATYGHRRERKPNPGGLPIQRIASVRSGLHPLHRFVYLPLVGESEQVSKISAQVLSWLALGHSISYLKRSSVEGYPTGVFQIFPKDVCLCDAAGFVGLNYDQHSGAASKLLRQEVSHGFLMALHQRFFALALSLQCARETSHFEGASLDDLTKALGVLRFRSLQFRAKSLRSEISVFAPIQRAYAAFLKGMNVEQVTLEMQAQIREMQQFLERREAKEARDSRLEEMEKARISRDKRERTQLRAEENARAFQWVGGFLAAIAIPLTVVTGIYGTNHVDWMQNSEAAAWFWPSMAIGVLCTIFVIFSALAFRKAWGWLNQNRDSIEPTIVDEIDVLD